MEKECKHLSTQNKILDSFREQRNSPELSSRSTIYNKKCSFSPSISEKSNVSAKKADSDENYRRLVLRTLKNKAIRWYFIPFSQWKHIIWFLNLLRKCCQSWYGLIFLSWMKMKMGVRSSKKRSGPKSWYVNYHFWIFIHNLRSLNCVFLGVVNEGAVASFGAPSIYFEIPAKIIFLDFKITGLRL